LPDGRSTQKVTLSATALSEEKTGAL
jgi:hypothetical protein